jgi:hypothetical protein
VITKAASKKRTPLYFEKNVEVEIDEEDLEEAGYHHKDDCPARTRPSAASEIADALASLHRQAHPGAHPEIFMCPQEPCRSLGMDVLGYGPPP